MYVVKECMFKSGILKINIWLSPRNYAEPSGHFTSRHIVKTLSAKRVVFIASKSSLNTWRQSLYVRECPTSVVIIPELALTSSTINQWLITTHVHHVDSSCDADGLTENSSSCLRLMLENLLIMNIQSNKM